MKRAYGTLQFRAVDEEQRIIEGVANTPAVDSYGTVIDPRGAEFELPLPFLWQHFPWEPVGHVVSATVDDKEIRVRVQLQKSDRPGKVQERLDAAWDDIRLGLVRGLSIGFESLEQKGNKFIRWAWRELSAVTIPANQEANIQAVRSAFLAASGDPQPGVSGTPNQSNPSPRRGTKMTILEQIRDHENSRAAKVARKTALMEAASGEGRTLDETESEEFDTLDTEIRSIDGHLTRLNSLKRDNETRAVPVDGSTPEKAAQTRAGVPVVKVKSNEAPGVGFARYAMSLLACNGNRYEAAQYAERAWGEQGQGVALMHRAAVAPGTTTDATFAKPLVETNYLDEFLEMLRPATLIGRIPGLKQVPFNVSMPSQTAGGTYKWVGEGAGKPVTNAQFGTVTLGMAKASGIIVLTEELVRSSKPSAQEVVRDELIKGVTQFLDSQFIDPAVAAVSNVSPASITNGVSGTAASGTTEAAARADPKALLGGFATGNYGLGSVVLLMSESIAFTLAATVNAVGELAFPGMTATGGNLLGIPVVTSNAVGAQIVAVHAPSILLADEGGVEIDVSREATIRMDSAPDTEAGDPAALPGFRSLWQDNLVGLRAERFINWGKARSDAVRRIHTVAYL